MVTRDIPPNLEYARRLRSIYTAAGEFVLRHNFDILPSMRIHFPEEYQNVFPKPGSKDTCFHKRMLLAGLRFPLQLIARELLCYLWLSLFQIMPNG